MDAVIPAPTSPHAGINVNPMTTVKTNPIPEDIVLCIGFPVPEK